MRQSRSKEPINQIVRTRRESRPLVLIIKALVSGVGDGCGSCLENEYDPAPMIVVGEILVQVLIARLTGNVLRIYSSSQFNNSGIKDDSHNA